MSDNKNYMLIEPERPFDQMIPERRRIIEAASSEFPRYEYNANTLARKLHPSVQHVVVKDIQNLNGAKCYTIAPDMSEGTDELACFRAGQYISLKLKIGESVLSRPYSLISSPKEALGGKEGIYRIIVKDMQDGFASGYINREFSVGTKLDISEPSGFFNYEPLRDAQTVVAAAGGSGIAPFMSMAEAIADGTEEFDMLLLYGSKTEEEIYFKDRLEELSKASEGRIKVIYVLSDEEKEGYEKGFITDELIQKCVLKGSDYSLFVCGSQGMYDYMESVAEKLGLPKRRVRFDAYGQYKLAVRDEEFISQYKDKIFNLTVVTGYGLVKTVPARADEPILVALERAGVTAPSKCRSGECGFCRSKLVSGEVYIPDKTEARREYDRLKGYIHPCCTFPKSDCRILVNIEEPKVERKVKDMKKKERIMGLVMAIIISAAMGVAATFFVRLFNPQAAAMQPLGRMMLSNVGLSLLLGIIISFVLPLGKLGKNLAKKANANPPSFKFTLLNSLPISVINTVIIGCILSGFGIFMARIGVKRAAIGAALASGAPADVAAQAGAEALSHMPPFPVMWIISFLQILGPTLVISYLLAVILSPIVSQAVGLADAGAEVGKSASGKDE